MTIFLQNLLAIFCPGRKKFCRPAPATRIFGKLKILTYQKNWKWPKITQNDPNFQECHLGANTCSRHFSKFFVKNNAYREDFWPIFLNETQHFLVHIDSKKAKILIFDQKSILAEISASPKMGVLGAGWPKIFRSEPKNCKNPPPQKKNFFFSWCQHYFGVLEPP